MLRRNTLILLGALTTGSAFAGITDGNFEALSGEWDAINGGVTSDYNSVTAPEGQYFGYGNSMKFATLLRNTAEDLSSPSGSTLKFLYNFWTDETADDIPIGSPYNDQFELRLLGSMGTNAVYKIHDVFQGGFTTTSSAKPTNFYASTGWQWKSIDISGYQAALQTGEVTNILFGVYDAGDGLRASGFGVDTLEAVPEPATMAILGLGLAALGRRRSK